MVPGWKLQPHKPENPGLIPGTHIKSHVQWSRLYSQHTYCGKKGGDRETPSLEHSAAAQRMSRLRKARTLSEVILMRDGHPGMRSHAHTK